MLALLFLGGCRLFNDAAYDTRAPYLTDGDGDGFRPADGDCDDANTAVFPEAAEVCDGLDNDCDERVDEEPSPTISYADADGDGYGDPDLPSDRCFPADTYLPVGGDCHDGDPAIHPDAAEICNDLDDNCVGGIDEPGELVDYTSWYLDIDEDGWGDPRYTVTECAPPPGYTAVVFGDCDDGDAAIHPDAEEVCNDAVDNDCDDAADCLLEGELDGAGTAFARVVGGHANQGLGIRVIALGDVDGDDGEDFAVLGSQTVADGDCRVFRGGLAGERSDASATLSIAGDWKVDDIVYSEARDAFLVGDPYRFGYAGALHIVDAGTTGALTLSDESAVLIGTSDENLGYRLATSTTMTADGAERILMSTPSDSAIATYAGRLDILDGDLAILATVRGARAEEWVGATLEVVPDLDGDGLDDLAVAGDSSGGIYNIQGQLAVFHAPVEGDLAFADGDVVLRGAAAYAYLGRAVTGADYDADGYNDLFVSSPGEEGGAASTAGYVYGLPGPLTGIPYQANPATLDRVFTIEGSGVDALFGGSLASGDFNGDGIPDLAVGAPWATPPGMVSESGLAFLLYGPFDFDRALTLSAEAADGAMLMGEEDTRDSFGWSIAALNLNNDPISDLLVGVPGADANGIDDAGVVYAILGQGF